MQDQQALKRRRRQLDSSRSGWTRRVSQKQASIRALRVRVRDLEASRQLWKRRALAAEARLGCPSGGS